MTRLLAELPLQAGLRFGVWAVWRDGASADDPNDFYIIHRGRGWMIYSPIASNGWFNYTDDAGTWRLHYGWLDDTPEPQDRADVRAERFLGREPAGDWPAGRFAEEGWVVEADGDRLRIFHGENDAPLVLWRGRDLWTFGKKPPAGCCEG